MSTWPDGTRYLHRDNLGSIDTITDGRGNVVERMSYEAFGQRRAGNWRAADDPLAGIILPAFTNRGFTGYEHVDEMGLIHMNGRVYDSAVSSRRTPISRRPIQPKAITATAMC